jgi:hypothetical protein
MKEQQELQTVQDFAEIARSVWTEIDFDSIDSSRDLRDEFVNAIEDSASVGSILDYPDELAREMDVRSLSEDSQAHDIAASYAENGGSRRALRIARKRPRLVFLEMEDSE